MQIICATRKNFVSTVRKEDIKEKARIDKGRFVTLSKSIRLFLVDESI